MATRIGSLLYIPMMAIAGLSVPAHAQQPLIGIDGCAILASVVYTEVTEARLGYSVGPHGAWLYTGRNELTLCNQTARSTTSSFTAALRQANIYVTWGLHTGYSGDYCLSHFLSQCYPTGDPAMPPLSKADRSFVMRSWQAVYDSISGRMSMHPGSDVSRFHGSQLGQSIRRSITASNIDYQSQLNKH